MGEFIIRILNKHTLTKVKRIRANVTHRVNHRKTVSVQLGGIIRAEISRKKIRNNTLGKKLINSLSKRHTGSSDRSRNRNGLTRPFLRKFFI